jgi:hypothetical protein
MISLTYIWVGSPRNWVTVNNFALKADSSPVSDLSNDVLNANGVPFTIFSNNFQLPPAIPDLDDPEVLEKLQQRNQYFIVEVSDRVFITDTSKGERMFYA